MENILPSHGGQYYMHMEMTMNWIAYAVLLHLVENEFEEYKVLNWQRSDLTSAHIYANEKIESLPQAF